MAAPAGDVSGATGPQPGVDTTGTSDKTEQPKKAAPKSANWSDPSCRALPSVKRTNITNVIDNVRLAADAVKIAAAAAATAAAKTAATTKAAADNAAETAVKDRETAEAHLLYRVNDGVKNLSGDDGSAYNISDLLNAGRCIDHSLHNRPAVTAAVNKVIFTEVIDPLNNTFSSGQRIPLSELSEFLEKHPKIKAFVDDQVGIIMSEKTLEKQLKSFEEFVTSTNAHSIHPALFKAIVVRCAEEMIRLHPSDQRVIKQLTTTVYNHAG